MQGEKCTFAHGMPDMVEIAQQGFVNKVEAGIAKKNTPVASFGFMPMQVRRAPCLPLGNRKSAMGCQKWDARYGRDCAAGFRQ
jgi:hypothetical protein